jgi:hypothetical protein
MCHVLPRSSWLLAAGSLGLLAALLICAGPAHAQQRPSKEPSTQDYARQFEKDVQEAEGYDAATRNVVRGFKAWVGFIVLGVVVVSAVIAFKVALWFYSRASATTDPEKLAMNDPWIRAHLASQKAEGDAPPNPEQ